MVWFLLQEVTVRFLAQTWEYTLHQESDPPPPPPFISPPHHQAICLCSGRDCPAVFCLRLKWPPVSLSTHSAYSKRRRCHELLTIQQPTVGTWRGRLWRAVIQIWIPPTHFCNLFHPILTQILWNSCSGILYNCTSNFTNASQTFCVHYAPLCTPTGSYMHICGCLCTV